GPAHGPRGHERQEAVREGKGEDQDVRHAVRGQPLVVAAQLREVGEEVDVRVGERVGQAVEDPGDERAVADVDRPAQASLVRLRHLEATRVVDRRRTHPAMTFPNIVWCPSPQYSWQMTVYSPGSLKVCVAVTTCPGMSMMFTRVPSMKKPWMTSCEVPMKVTFAPTGTRISWGSKLHARPIRTASYWFGPTWRTPGWSKGGVDWSAFGSPSATRPGRCRPMAQLE